MKRSCCPPCWDAQIDGNSGRSTRTWCPFCEIALTPNRHDLRCANFNRWYNTYPTKSMQKSRRQISKVNPYDGVPNPIDSILMPVQASECANYVTGDGNTSRLRDRGYQVCEEGDNPQHLKGCSVWKHRIWDQTVTRMATEAWQGMDTDVASNANKAEYRAWHPYGCSEQGRYDKNENESSKIAAIVRAAQDLCMLSDAKVPPPPRPVECENGEEPISKPQADNRRMGTSKRKRNGPEQAIQQNVERSQRRGQQATEQKISERSRGCPPRYTRI